MMKRTGLPIWARLLSLATLLAACGAQAHDCTEGSVSGAAQMVVSSAWVRTPPSGAKVAVGYLRIDNLSAQDDRLLSAASTRAGRIEMHSMEMNGSMMSMRPLIYGAEVPAGGAFMFSPIGAHMMFINIGAAYKEGDAIPVRLVFRNAGAVDACLAVRTPKP
jgi:periplasmic copper chaperone A